MPKSDTWPGGPGLETMIGMDSAGSCDSVDSANSALSDDSLDHLSAEEKACLLFLEETIESLDTEEDSGLSNDEPDQLPNSANLGLADLSASMNKTKPNSTENLSSEEPMKENVSNKLLQTNLVPTPFVLAASARSANTGVPLNKNKSSQPPVPAPRKQPDLKDNQKSAAPLPTPPPPPSPPPPPALPIKPKEVSIKTAEVPLPRGPLSYDALVHLRKSAATKKTPLCPKIDHTIDLENHLPAPAEGPKQGSEKSDSQVPTSKTVPPVVAPRPRKIPAGVSVKTPHQAPVSSDSSCRVKQGNDPKVVRLEALHKLGLIKEQESENETVAPLPPPKPHSLLKPTSNRLMRGLSNAEPDGLSFCHSQVLTEPKNKPLQSSASFDHPSRYDQQPVSASVPAQSNGVKLAGLGRSATVESHTDLGHRPKPQPIPAPKPTSAAQALPSHASSAVGYTIMVVPGMGADRKEALRKLGLLKT